MNILLNQIVNNLQTEIPDIEIEFRISKMTEYDLQINNLVQFKNLPEFENLTKKLISILENQKIFYKIEVTEQGFINLAFNNELLAKKISNSKIDFKLTTPKNILIDYGGPNIGKPLHVGHIRTLNIGRSLYNMHNFVSNNIKSDIHLGDWGMPIAQIITYINQNNLKVDQLAVEDFQTIYPKSASEYKENKKFKTQAQEVNKLLNSNDQTILSKWRIIKDKSLTRLKEDLNVLGHSFDYWLGESDVNDLIPDMIEELKEKKLIKEDDGALVSSEDADPKILITKSDGSYLYITTDLATTLYRQQNLHYDEAIYVVDRRQSLHFEQLFRSIKYFGFNDLRHEHISYGTLNDAKGNPFKTRDGDTKPLLELFEEVKEYIKKFNEELNDSTLNTLTNSVLTYSDLLSNRKTDYKFVLEKFASNTGKTGIYVQYSQVRAKKLLERFKNEKNAKLREFNEAESNLVRELFLFGIYLEQSLKNYEPHHLANFLYEVSNLFNVFYEDEKFIDLKDSESLNTKLFVTNLFLTTVHNTMYCLGIKPVEEM
jgi:arginyl-tRNA synthetase